MTYLFGIFVVFWSVLAWAEESKNRLTVCAISIANPPFYLHPSEDPDDGNYAKGVAFELMKELERRLNISILVKRNPWKRCMLSLEHGEIDGLLGASYLAERRSIGHYPLTVQGEPDYAKQLYSSHYWLYAKNPAVSWDGQQLILPPRSEAGTGLGFSSVKLLSKLNVPVVEEYLPARLVTLLENDRVAVIAGYTYQFSPYIAQSKESKSIYRLPIPLQKDDMFLLFSNPYYHANTDQAESIWSALAEIHRSGQYDAMMNKQLLHLNTLPTEEAVATNRPDGP